MIKKTFGRMCESMIIKNLKISGFKHIPDNVIKTFEFYNHNLIKGENFAGKTTICEAICWLFLGCNINGHVVYEKLLLNNDSDKMSVEADFIDNEGSTHVLKRIKSSTTNLILDGKPINPNVLTSYIGDKEVFMSCFVLGYFEKYSSREARDLLMKVLPSISYTDILDKMPIELSSFITKSIVNNPNTILKEKRARIKEIEKEKIFLKGQLSVLETSITNPNSNTHINTNELNDKISKLEKEIIELNIQLSLPNKIETLSNEKKLLRKQYDLLKDKLLVSNLNEGQKCPLCFQLVSTEAINNIKIQSAEINLSVQNEMNELVQKGNDLNNQLEELSKSKTHKSSYSIEAELIQLTEKLGVYKSQYKNLLENSTRQELSNKSLTAKREIEHRLLITSEEKAELEQIIAAISCYNSIKSEEQFKFISSHFDKVSIRLEKLVKSTGELKECFEILYDDKDFMLLSNSEKIRTALEISNLINAETKLNLPVFIDNAESITHYIKPNRQIFEAIVVKNSELVIEES